MGRVMHQMKQRDQGVRLATTIGEFELTNGFVVLACQPSDDISGQLSQVKRGIGKREELLRVLIHRACLPHDHVVQISSKDRQTSNPRGVARPYAMESRLISPYHSS